MIKMNLAEYIADRMADLGEEGVEKAVSIDEDTSKKTKLFLARVLDLEFLISVESKELSIRVKTGMEKADRCLHLLDSYILRWSKQDIKKDILNPRLENSIFTAQINSKDEGKIYDSVKFYFIEPVLRYLYPERYRNLLDSE